MSDGFFRHVSRLDAVGTLYEEAAINFVDAMMLKPEDAPKWKAAADAIKAAWPENVAKSLGKSNKPLP